MTVFYSTMESKLQDKKDWPSGKFSFSWIYNTVYSEYDKNKYIDLIRACEDYSSGENQILYYAGILVIDKDPDFDGKTSFRYKPYMVPDEIPEDALETWNVIKDRIESISQHHSFKSESLGELMKLSGIGYSSKASQSLRSELRQSNSRIHQVVADAGYFSQKRVDKRGGCTFWITREGASASYKGKYR